MKKKLTALLTALTLCVGLAVPALAATDVIDSSDVSRQLNVSNPYTDIENWGADTTLPQEMVYVFPAGTTIQVAGEISRIEVTVYPAGAKGGYEYDGQTYAAYQPGQTIALTGSYTKLELIVGSEVRDYIFVRASGSAASAGAKPAETTPTAQPGTGLSFADVAADAYYADPVGWAVAEGITSGTSATTFSPNATCTRGQIITFLWRADGSEEPEYADSFPDVDANAYYFKATQWAHEWGVETRDPEGAFTPDGPCTRAMAVEFMWRLAGSPEVGGSLPFTDVAANASYASAVAWALREGVTSGTSATTFSPNATCTRGQIVTFLYRAFGE